MKMKKVRWAFHLPSWNPLESEWCKAVQLIQCDEKDRIDKFKYQIDAKASLVGRLFLRRFVGQKLGVKNDQMRWTRTDRGKPIVIDGCDGWDYNVSHAGDWVVIAANEGVVGVDVMKLVDKRIDRLENFFHLMNKQFTVSEWQVIRNKDNDEKNKLARFFRNWALKESYVKAVGTGLNINLRTLNFIIENEIETGKVECKTKLNIEEKKSTNWHFEESFLDEEHVVCVALKMATSDTDEPEFFQVLNISDVLGFFDSKGLVFNPKEYELFLSKEKQKPF